MALKSFLPQYEGRVKCVYIDSPYNTGNESRVYNDKVNSPQMHRWLGQVVGRDGEDLSRHDKWLCLQGLRKRGANFRREDRPNMFYSFFYDPRSDSFSVDELLDSINYPDLTLRV